MKVQVSLSKLLPKYSKEVTKIMIALRKSKSRHCNAKPEELNWKYYYGHYVGGHSKDPNSIEDASGRANAWIDKIGQVSIEGSIGRWSNTHPSSLYNGIPKEIYDNELQCAKEAIEREKNSIPLSKREMDLMIKDGFKLNEIKEKR